jgi:hypothetical protein
VSKEVSELAAEGAEVGPRFTEITRRRKDLLDKRELAGSSSSTISADSSRKDPQRGLELKE